MARADVEPLPGYEHLHSQNDDFVIPPPSYDEVIGEEPQSRPGFENIPRFTEEEVKDALMDFVAQRCCYDTDPATQMTILDIKQTSAFRYTLETFSENRTTKYVQKPYTGGYIDGPENGIPPGPWEIVPAYFPSKYEDKTLKMVVPHSSTLIPCPQCSKKGYILCSNCHGQREVNCSFCRGKGYLSTTISSGINLDMMEVLNGPLNDCPFCLGEHQRYLDCHDVGMVSCPTCECQLRTHNMHHRSRRQPERTECPGCVNGRTQCFLCTGIGTVSCPNCIGQGSLHNYIQLKIKWTNHQSDHVLERSNLPKKCIRKAAGLTVFEEDAARVFPINNFPEQVINEASERLIQDHSFAYQNERIHVQSHLIKLVPVAEVSCHWKLDKQFNYFVYGLKRSVYASDYPQNCCWGLCVIL